MTGAKFYTWSLQLFGTEYDPNSMNSGVNRNEGKSKVVRNVEQDKKDNDDDRVVAVSDSSINAYYY